MANYLSTNQRCVCPRATCPPANYLSVSQLPILQPATSLLINDLSTRQRQYLLTDHLPVHQLITYPPVNHHPRTSCPSANYLSTNQLSVHRQLSVHQPTTCLPVNYLFTIQLLSTSTVDDFLLTSHLSVNKRITLHLPGDLAITKLPANLLSNSRLFTIKLQHLSTSQLTLHQPTTCPQDN